MINPSLPGNRHRHTHTHTHKKKNWETIKIEKIVETLKKAGGKREKSLKIYIVVVEQVSEIHPKESHWWRDYVGSSGFFKVFKLSNLGNVYVQTVWNVNKIVMKILSKAWLL